MNSSHLPFQHLPCDYDSDPCELDEDPAAGQPCAGVRKSAVATTPEPDAALEATICMPR